jgi:peptidoglycan/xylan/chitin deacetylase (PgdA/CDA1 family)
VALTFDAEHPDRPAKPGNEERLLDALETLGVRATFFLQGRWAEAYPATARRIADRGHVVGNHSHYHAHLPRLSARGLAWDIAAAERVIRDVTGADPRPWFRCPFGAGAADARVVGAIAAAGYRHVGWTLDTRDWDGGRSGEDLATVIVDGVRGVDDAIVLLHAWPDRTVSAIDGTVRRLREAGLELVGIDELAHVTAMPADRA